MYHKVFLQLIVLTNLCQTWASITGITYMDPIVQRRKEDYSLCNSLYWYPQNLPDFCYTAQATVKPREIVPPPPPAPTPVPAPSYVPAPAPGPMYYPAAPPAQMPYVPQPMMPVLPAPAPLPQPPLFTPASGMVHPLSPMFSPYLGMGPQYMRPPPPPLIMPNPGNFAINILPFTDVYSDMMEKGKNDEIMSKMTMILRKYSKMHDMQ